MRIGYTSFFFFKIKVFSCILVICSPRFSYFKTPEWNIKKSRATSVTHLLNTILQRHLLETTLNYIYTSHGLVTLVMQRIANRVNSSISLSTNQKRACFEVEIQLTGVEICSAGSCRVSMRKDGSNWRKNVCQICDVRRCGRHFYMRNWPAVSPV